MSEKVAIVTGASRGIGKGIALALCRNNYTVYITGRNKDTLQQACDDIAKQTKNTKCYALVCDHSKDSQVVETFNKVLQKHGKLDVLVNNAYGAVEALATGDKLPPFWEKDFKVWDASHIVGLRSHYIATSIVAKFLVDKKQKGLIVNVSSPGGLKALIDVAYGVGKIGLDRLTADTALELKPYGVTVVSLWPGAVATELVVKGVIENPNAHPKAKQMFADAESPEFSGKAVVALAADPNLLELTGKVLLTGELANYYKYTDDNGKIPGTGWTKFFREEMKKPPSQWVPPSKL